MLIDFREFPNFDEIHCDVCIIGSGAAGITMALELDGSGLDVIVLAGGPLRNEPESQDLYRSQVVGLKHVGIHEGRARVHGGSTTLWKGQSLTLDPIDFQSRDWVPFSGWPFGRETLDPFYLRADHVMNLPTIAHDETSWPKNRPKPPKFTPSTLHARLSQFTSVPDFSVMYREKLKASTNIRVFLNAHVTNLVTNSEGTRLDTVEVKSLDGRTNTLKPRATVVCCGAIETARLLLASDSFDPRGVGNTHDLVGRFFQEHIQGKMTVIRPTNRKLLRETFGVFADKGTRYAPKICATESLQRRERILNVYGDLSYEMPEDSAVEAAKILARAPRRRDLRAKVPRALWNVAKRPHEVILAVAKYAIDRTPMTPTRGPIYLGVQAEQAPNPHSRLTLGDDRDALGMRRSVLDWQVTDLDRHSLLVYVKAVSEEFARLGLGEVDLKAFHLPDDLAKMDERIIDCNHHIGTTRMSDDPKYGVVDRECRVHGIANLSIGSSAVFPTGGASNPTLTIIALCLRMADRLKRELATQPV